MFTVYVIRSDKTDKVYIGQTANLDLRLKRHNGELRSKPGSYTVKNTGRWNVVYQEKYLTRGEAIKREKYLKSHVGRDYLRMVLGR